MNYNVMPLLALLPLAQGVMAQKQPNIILIMSDQHRGDALNCMGNPSVISPNIDALAADGTLFTNAYSSAPSSTPARAGLLTGLSPWHHGMMGYGRMGTHYQFEMPQMLRDLGFFTFGIGKMHWFPQKSLHGFHGTLLDESGRVDTKDFISDYRLWFNTQVPGLNPDSTGIGWNEHRGGIYKLDENLHPTHWTAETAINMIHHYKDGNGQPLFLKILKIYFHLHQSIHFSLKLIVYLVKVHIIIYYLNLVSHNMDL